MQIWTALLNRDYMGFEPELLAPKYVSILRELPNKLMVTQNP